VWFEDDLTQSELKKVEARTPKALVISPESNFWGDQWHVDEIEVIDLIYNTRVSNPGGGYRLVPTTPSANYASLAVYHKENVLRDPTASSDYYLPRNNCLLTNSEREYPLSDDFKQLEPESIKNISSGLSVVYLWSFKGKLESWGHVSLGLSDGTYISWWPQAGDESVRTSVLPEFINNMAPSLRLLYLAPALPNQTYEMDSKLEGWVEGKLKDAKPKHADITITIPDLNVAAIKVWWENFKSNPANKWETVGQNCAKTVCDALFHGSIYLPQYEDSMVREWRRRHPSNDVLYTPEYVQYLAYQIANDQFKKRSQPSESSHPRLLNFSFMAMPRSVPDHKIRSTPENKYDRKENSRLSFSSSREKDHKEASATTVSDSPKLPSSVKLRYAMWGLPPPELIIEAPVQNEKVLSK
jgi:hypothetical protein